MEKLQLKLLLEELIGGIETDITLRILDKIDEKLNKKPNTRNQEILDKVVYAKDKKAAKLERAKDEGFEIYKSENPQEIGA